MVVVGAIAAALFPSAAVAAFPGDNGRIAYAGAHWGIPPEASDNPPDDHIFTVRPDGSGRQQLTDNSFDESDPSWSADGGSLVFSRALGGVPGRPSGYQVFKMNADGSEQTQVTHISGTAASPSLSPSGRRIVYRESRSGAERSSISTIGHDGTDPRRLVSSGLRRAVSSPQYSPSGRRIVFAGRPRGTRTDAIWSVRRDGSRLRRLSDPAPDDDFEPDYSPDGRHIAFVRCDTDAVHGCAEAVYLMRADGSRERPIPGTSGALSPAYAPAGDRIALAGEPIAAPFPFTSIFTINLAGDDRRQVAPCEGCRENLVRSPSWQPVPDSR
jgi:TolB protein